MGVYENDKMLLQKRLTKASESIAKSLENLVDCANSKIMLECSEKVMAADRRAQQDWDAKCKHPDRLTFLGHCHGEDKSEMPKAVYVIWCKSCGAITSSEPTEGGEPNEWLLPVG